MAVDVTGSQSPKIIAELAISAAKVDKDFSMESNGHEHGDGGGKNGLTVIGKARKKSVMKLEACILGGHTIFRY